MFFKAQYQNDWNGVNTVKVLVGDVLFPYLKVGVIDQNVEKNKKVTFRILFERISMVEASERMKIENLV